MRNHSAAGSRTHSRQNSQSRGAAASPSGTASAAISADQPTPNAAWTIATNAATVPLPPPYHHDVLPPQMSKWITSLQEAFVADLQQIQHDLDATNRETLAALASAHAAQLADLESKLQAAQDALLRAQPAINYRPQAHRLLADVFRAKLDTKSCSVLLFLWRKRANVARQDRRKLAAANRHMQKALLRKAFDGWFQAVRDAWRQEREKRLDTLTKQAVAQATHDLESRLRDLTRELQDEKRRRDDLVRQQRAHEAEMRAAFVRGLSALNMETMAVLQPMMAQTMHAPDDADEDRESIIVVQPDDEPSVMEAHHWTREHTPAPEVSTATPGNAPPYDNPADPLRLSVLSSSFSSIHRSSSPIPSGVARTASPSHGSHDRPSAKRSVSRPPSAAATHIAIPGLAGKRSQGGSMSAPRRSSFSFRPPATAEESPAPSSRNKAPDPVRLMQRNKHHSSTSSIKSLREPVYVERHARPVGRQGSGVGGGKGHTERLGPGMATGFFSPS